MKSYTAIEVAKRFLELAKGDGADAIRDISNMKLQKLVFFAHLVSLAMAKSEPLVSDSFHAWDYGPVEPKLYRRIRHFGARHFTLEDESVAAEFAGVKEVDDPDAIAIIAATWDKFKSWTSVQLSELTHRRNSPWAVVYVRDRYGVIPNATIRKRLWGDE